MEIESTLRVINKSQVKELPGVVEGQTVQPLVGVPEFPSERVRVAVATFKAGTHEELHWHAIEVFYYVMAGSATVRDYHGKEYAGQRRIRHLRAARHRGLARMGSREGRPAAPLHTRHARRPQAHAVHRGSRNAALVHRAGRAGEDGRGELSLALLRKA